MAKITPNKKETAPKKTAAKKVSAKKTVTPKKETTKKETAPKIAKEKTVKIPKKVVTMHEGELLAITVAQGMFERKAENIRILDLRNIPSASADFFVISSANNDKQVEAIAWSADEEVKKQLKQTPWHREGFDNCHWVLLDYIDVVAHVFLDEMRDFYDLESLWGDAIDIPFKGK